MEALADKIDSEGVPNAAFLEAQKLRRRIERRTFIKGAGYEACYVQRVFDSIVWLCVATANEGGNFIKLTDQLGVDIEDLVKYGDVFKYKLEELGYTVEVFTEEIYIGWV